MASKKHNRSKEDRQAMLLSSLIEEYVSVQRARTKRDEQGSLSKTTLDNYVCRLRRFGKFHKDVHLSDLTAKMVRLFCAEQAQTVPKSIPMYLASLRHFCAWAREEGWITGDPCKAVPLPRIRRERRQPVPEDDLAKLLDACDRLPRNPYRRRLAKAVMAILVYSGLRRGEVLALRVEDWNSQRRSLLVQNGKGGKSRVVFLPKEAAALVDAYVAVRPADAAHTYLLAFDRRNRLGLKGLRQLLYDLHDVAGIKDRYSPHQFRHACLSRLLQNGAPISSISVMAGHTRMETTAIYLHASEREVEKIAECAALQRPPERQNTKREARPMVRRRFSVSR